MADKANMQVHRSTYEGVIGWLKWGAVASFVIAFFVIWLIA